MKYTTVNLELSEHHKLKVHCAELNRPMNEYVVEAIHEKMGREPLAR